jgi:hypothetical protein
MSQSSMTGNAMYGPALAIAPSQDSNPSPTGSNADAGDPHDKSDRGPADWFDDPTVWVVGIAALATGVLGFRFHWGPGASVDAGARVDLGDEVTTLLATTLYSITGIILFKTAVSKVEIPALQKLAAAI